MSNYLILVLVFGPIVAAIVALILRRINQAQRWVAVLASASVCVASVVLAQQVFVDGAQSISLGNWSPPYGIILVADKLAMIFVVMASTVMFGSFLYTLNCKDESIKHPSFIPLFLSMQAGLMGAFLTGDVFTLFVFIELMVVTSICLVAISDNHLGLEAGVKYILISGMGTMFLLLGIGSVYAAFGTLNFADFAGQTMGGINPIFKQSAAIMLFCAFLLKSAVFPFHFWQPDFHTTAPTPLSAALSSVVVKVGVYGIIRMVTLLFLDEAPVIQNLLMALGVISIFFGGFSALRTYDGKRMLAYSTFGQVGFILLAIGWGNPLALAAALIFAFNHAFIKSSLLLIMGAIASRTVAKTARLSELSGVGHQMPWLLGILLFIGGMGLIGIPPLNGFISKYAIIQGGINAEHWGFVIPAVFGSLLTLLYVIRGWQKIFQQEPEETSAELKPMGKGDNYLAPLFLISLCVVFGVFAEPLLNYVNLAVEELQIPLNYIQAVFPEVIP